MNNKHVKIIAICTLGAAAVSCAVIGIRKLVKKVGETLGEIVNSNEINDEPNEHNSEVLRDAAAENACPDICCTTMDSQKNG